MKKPKPATCESCKHAKPTETALICNRYPPVAVVIENVAKTMRIAVQPSDQACGEYKGA